VIRKILNHLQQNGHLRVKFRGCAPDSEKIRGALGMQDGPNSISMAVDVMQKGFYSSYTRL